MRELTYIAIEESTQKWLRILNEGFSDRGGENCALCKRFTMICEMRHEDGSIEECPVYESTGNIQWVNTPYYAWIKHHWEYHLHSSQKKVEEGCAECEELAEAEVAFLKSLLPE